MIDYLDIEYTRRNIASRYRKHHDPDHRVFGNDNGRNWVETGPNVIRFDKPLAIVKAWEILPSANLVAKADYVKGVQRPFEVAVRRPGNWRGGICPIAAEESLYGMSYAAAFPPKAGNDFFRRFSPAPS